MTPREFLLALMVLVAGLTFFLYVWTAPSLAEQIADLAPCDTEVLTTAGTEQALDQVEANIEGFAEREGVGIELARAENGEFLVVVMTRCGADRMEQ